MINFFSAETPPPVQLPIQGGWGVGGYDGFFENVCANMTNFFSAETPPPAQLLIQGGGGCTHLRSMRLPP